MPVGPDSTRVLRGKSVCVLSLVQVLGDARLKYSKQPAIEPCSQDKLLALQATNPGDYELFLMCQ